MQTLRLRGFTLVEIIITMGILSMVSVLTVLAVNPARQFSQTRNSQRQTDITRIKKAIETYAADNNSLFPSSLTGLPKIIGTKGTIGTATEKDHYIDLRADILYNYLNSIPFDPQTGTEEDTRYLIYRTPHNKIAIKSLDAELDQSVAYNTDNYALQLANNENPSTASGTTPDHDDFEFAGKNFTFMTWIKTGKLSAQMVAEKQNPSFTGTFLIALNRDNAVPGRFSIFDGYGAAPGWVDSNSTDLTNGGWHHIAATYNNGVYSLYKDGVLDRTDTRSSLYSASNLPFNVAQAFTNNLGWGYEGLLDDMRIYNTALTAEEIQSIALSTTVPAETANLIAYWDFDDTALNEVVDQTGRGHNLTITAAAPTSGKYGNAYLFGQTATGGAYDDTAHDFGSKNFSLAFWLKTTMSSNGMILDKVAPGCCPTLLVAINRDTWCCGNGTVGRYSIWTGYQWVDSNFTNINDGNWHHVVFTYDQTTMRLYHDGTLDRELVTNVNYPDYGNQLYLGYSPSIKSASGLGWYFNGMLDDMRIYDHVLTLNEIQQLQLGNILNTGLVSYWSFDNTEGLVGANGVASKLDFGFTGNPIWLKRE